MWDLSCPDWETRIREGRSLVPEGLPLCESEAEMALAFFDELQLPDVPGTPKLRTASGQWFRDIVRVAFGSWDPSTGVRNIRDIFSMVPKGSSKTTYSAALLLVAMLMNRRPRAEALFIGPTQSVSDRAYDQAVGMIELSPDLKRRFKTREHVKTIEDLVTGAELKVKTFDLSILTGAILFFVLLDELHVLGKSVHTTKVLRQIRGGLEKTPEGTLLITTTQSDDIPQGAFRDELKFARKIRDGEYRGRAMRPMLPLLYEFPHEIAKTPEQWQDIANWPMVMPNLGRGVNLESLSADWASEREKGPLAINIWASQHLNIEIGVGINNDGWGGAESWQDAGDAELSLETLLDRSEVVTIGIDGGGRDDLLGMAVIGREKGTRKWLSWCHAWADHIVLERRKDIAAQLRDFESEGTLTICRIPEDLAELGAIVARIHASGLLPDKNAIGLDPNNAASVLEALFAVGIEEAMIRRLLQGPALAPAIYQLDRKLGDGTMHHAEQLLMDWVVGNAKVESRGNALMITKQISGRAKIDPLIALFQAAIVMSWNPSAGMLLTGADILTVI